MDPWDHIRRAVSDTRSGSVQIAERASRGLERLTTRRDVLRASRALLRAHPAMGALWRLSAAAFDGPDAVVAYRELLATGTAAAADSTRWVVTKRNSVVLTHSGSGSVIRALHRVRGKIALVLCTTSLPGGEGRALAKRLERDGFETEVVPDAAIARACSEADVALVGADAVTEDAVINKVGTALVALGAQEAGIGCYAVAATAKLVPGDVWRPDSSPAYEDTPLELFDAVLTERGPKRAGAIRRAAGRVRIPDALLKIKV
jgi:methylthioribose-1-phosphate isomerase